VRRLSYLHRDDRTAADRSRRAVLLQCRGARHLGRRSVAATAGAAALRLQSFSVRRGAHGRSAADRAGRTTAELTPCADTALIYRTFPRPEALVDPGLARRSKRR